MLKSYCKEQGDFYEGVRIYPPAGFIDVSWLTGVVNKDGKLTHTMTGAGDKYCHPQGKRELVIRPDYSKSMQLVYKPGFLETNTFGVELKDGILVKVNTESSPDKGETFKNLASAAGEVAPLAGVALTGPQICTHIPELKFLLPVQTVCPGGVCDLKKYYPADP